jgi:hypothetical protein
MGEGAGLHGRVLGSGHGWLSPTTSLCLVCLLQGAAAAAPGPASSTGAPPVLVPGVFRAPSPTTATAAVGRPVAAPPPGLPGGSGPAQGAGLMAQGSGYSSSQGQVSNCRCCTSLAAATMQPCSALIDGRLHVLWSLVM